VAARIRRIPLPEVVAKVERKEAGGLAVQLGGHRDRVGVNGEVDEGTSSQRDVLVVAVGAVLLDRVLDVLAGEVILELGRRDRDAVEEEAEVDGLCGFGVEGQLPGDRQPVGVVVGHQLRRHAEGRLAIREADLHVLIADPVPEDVDRPALVDLL